MLFQPTLFSPISQYTALVQAKEVVFEMCDNYQKQTYRNRYNIYTAQGKKMLNVPIKHHKNKKQKTKEIKIDYIDNWQDIHLKTLTTAYNSSPFFEFYIDDLLPIYQKKKTFLIDLVFKSFYFITNALEVKINFTETKEYALNPKKDYRYLAIAKGKNNLFLNQRYIQVFENKHGFIPNLSILDLLFNEGPNTLNYLEQQAKTNPPKNK